MCPQAAVEKDRPKLIEKASLKPFDHGSEEIKYILASDDRHWVIAEELYKVLSLMDGTRTLDDIKRDLSKNDQLDITIEALERICDHYLLKKGLLQGRESQDNIGNKTRKQSKYFWFQVPIIPEGLLRKMTFLAIPFHKSVIVSVTLFCTPVVAYIMYLLVQPEFLQSIALVRGKDWFTLILIMLASGYLHELGHVGACLKYKMAPGHIGFAFYMTMPVLYADVSRVWNLKSKQRALVDVGGLYFEMVFLSILTLVSMALENKVILIGTAIRFIGMTYNFNPFLKMDGYWLFNDLTGITNLHDVTLDFFKDKIIRKISKSKSEIQKAYYTGLKPKIKNIFYAYVGASSVFFLFFIYILTIALITSIENIPVLVTEVIQFKQIMHSQFNWQTFGLGLVELFKDHALFILTFILIVRMIGKAVSSLGVLFLGRLHNE